MGLYQRGYGELVLSREDAQDRDQWRLDNQGEPANAWFPPFCCRFAVPVSHFRAPLPLPYALARQHQ